MLTGLLQVSFEGNRIDLVPGVELYNHDFNNLPDRDIKIHKLARKSLSIITSSEYTQKTIPIWMHVCSGGRSETELTVTQVKALLQPQNGRLVVLNSGNEVEYTATMNEFNIEWDGSNAWVQIVMIASTPLGQATEEQELTSITGITNSSDSSTFYVAGVYDAEPVVTLIINTVTGGTGGEISISNNRTNQGITIIYNFANGDIVQIDSANVSATVNGVEVDFEGLFPTFPAGSQQLGYTDTFSTRSVDLVANYKPRY